MQTLAIHMHSCIIFKIFSFNPAAEKEEKSVINLFFLKIEKENFKKFSFYGYGIL